LPLPEAAAIQRFGIQALVIYGGDLCQTQRRFNNAVVPWNSRISVCVNHTSWCPYATTTLTIRTLRPAIRILMAGLLFAEPVSL
jgi:hypothetical protein